MGNKLNTLPLIPSPQGRGDLRYLVPKVFGTVGSSLKEVFKL
jgi:hypothetical protein